MPFVRQFREGLGYGGRVIHAGLGYGGHLIYRASGIFVTPLDWALKSTPVFAAGWGIGPYFNSKDSNLNDANLFMQQKLGNLESAAKSYFGDFKDGVVNVTSTYFSNVKNTISEYVPSIVLSGNSNEAMSATGGLEDGAANATEYARGYVSSMASVTFPSLSDLKDGVANAAEYASSYLPSMPSVTFPSLSDLKDGVANAVEYASSYLPDLSGVKKGLKHSVDNAYKYVEDFCASKYGAIICKPENLGYFALTAATAATAAVATRYAWSAYKGRKESPANAASAPKPESPANAASAPRPESPANAAAPSSILPFAEVHKKRQRVAANGAEGPNGNMQRKQRKQRYSNLRVSM